MKNKDCVFCKIVKGEIKGDVVKASNSFIAIKDIKPIAEGHILVIPKKHYPWVWDYPNLGPYFELVGKLARHLRQVSGREIVRGLVYGVEVPHAHVWIFPGEKMGSAAIPYDKKNFKENAEKLRKALGS